MFAVTPETVPARLSSLRQYTQDGKRYTHKPLLVLLAGPAVRDRLQPTAGVGLLDAAGGATPCVA